ncbi:MAG TPA: glycosyltransferase [Candidatus Kapabacteria bacterium]|nr:glycosyltransferase [Candidatus Kapabacteria bacterium]
MSAVNKYRYNIILGFFKGKFPKLPVFLLKLPAYIYFYLVVVDCFRYNKLLASINFKQDIIDINSNTQIIYTDIASVHYVLTRLHDSVDNLQIVIYTIISGIFEKMYPYLIINKLNDNVKVLHVGTIDVLLLYNYKALFKECKKRGIFVIATYHSFCDMNVLKDIVKHCDVIFALSDSLKEELASNGIKNVITNYLPSAFKIDHNPLKKYEIRKSFNIPEEKIVLSIVGMLRPDKGLDFFIDSVSKLEDTYKDKIFINIIGTDYLGYKHSLPKPLAESGIQHRFIAKQTRLTDDEFVDNIIVSDIYLVPYTRPSINQSGPLIDAAVRKIPVIGTDNGTIGYTIKKWNIGLTFEHGNKEDLRNKIIQMIDNIDNLNFDFTQFIKEHSIEGYIGKHKQVYNSVINQNFDISMFN